MKRDNEIANNDYIRECKESFLNEIGLHSRLTDEDLEDLYRENKNQSIRPA